MNKEAKIVSFHVFPLDNHAEAQFEHFASNGSRGELVRGNITGKDCGILQVWTCSKYYIRKLEADNKLTKKKGEKKLLFAVYGVKSSGSAVNLMRMTWTYRKDNEVVTIPRVVKRRPKKK